MNTETQEPLFKVKEGWKIATSITKDSLLSENSYLSFYCPTMSTARTYKSLDVSKDTIIIEYEFGSWDVNSLSEVIDTIKVDWGDKKHYLWFDDNHKTIYVREIAYKTVEELQVEIDAHIARYT